MAKRESQKEADNRWLQQCVTNKFEKAGLSSSTGSATASPENPKNLACSPHGTAMVAQHDRAMAAASGRRRKRPGWRSSAYTACHGGRLAAVGEMP